MAPEDRVTNRERKTRSRGAEETDADEWTASEAMWPKSDREIKKLRENCRDLSDSPLPLTRLLFMKWGPVIHSMDHLLTRRTPDLSHTCSIIYVLLLCSTIFIWFYHFILGLTDLNLQHKSTCFYLAGPGGSCGLHSVNVFLLKNKR